MNVEQQIENTRYVFKGNGDMETQSTKSDSKYPGTWELSGQKIVVSMLAVQITLVFPIVIKTDPSAFFIKWGWISTFRS